MKKIVIGTRGSKLALNQTTIIKDKLQHLLPNTEIIIKVITTKGDTNMNPVPLDSIGKGWFTKEIDTALQNREIDIAVHSLKDLPEKLADGLMIAAIPEREDAREAMVSKIGVVFEKLPKSAIIGTDSTRRGSQILHKRGDLIVKSLRGNVNTRLEKLETQDYDAIFLAVAGLKRLGLEDRITQYFEADDLIPSPGQGALAVVTNKDNKPLNELLEQLNDTETVISVQAERIFSETIGGGCKTPVGAYAHCDGEKITIWAFVGSLDGTNVAKDYVTGKREDSHTLAKSLAENLLKLSKPWYTTDHAN